MVEQQGGRTANATSRKRKDLTMRNRGEEHATEQHSAHTHLLANRGRMKGYGEKLILSLVKHYNDYGGRPQYVQWARDAGTPINNDDDFHTNPIIKDYYKNHVKNVLTRINTITGIAYKDEATIMAWELMNEPRCQVDYSGNTVTTWVQEMAPYVKSIDSNHLLGVGMEGFYEDSIADRKQYNPGYQVGTDFISSNQINETDFTTIHAYPDSWLAGQSEDAQMEFMQRWMTSHWDDSATILKKPIVFCEFGKSRKDPGYSISARDSFMNSVYSSICNLAQKGGTFGGGLVWQLLDEGMDSHDDAYGIVLSKDASTCNVISQQSDKMTALELP
ncbi:mannan endo-1,4-beta-mannosidase 5-like [Prosopis cineraria]|uniref:mannan endo-1,4-beta-mannosidase 5-like n=1 Tax=Prosopis cineraria TaxID=364024 RepID=UPI00240EB411|nr:mannan endo-1,4-beta-mannosidase 5-like [Prosopis cineraria]